jgi:hypothetical protein
MQVSDASNMLPNLPDPILQNIVNGMTKDGTITPTDNCYMIGVTIFEKEPNTQSYFFIQSNKIIEESNQRRLQVSS